MAAFNRFIAALFAIAFVICAPIGVSAFNLDRTFLSAPNLMSAADEVDFYGAMAQAGVGALLLIDSDDLAASNVGRHMLGMESVGIPKAVAMARRLEADFPHAVSFESWTGGIEFAKPDQIRELASCDLIVAAGINLARVLEDTDPTGGIQHRSIVHHRHEVRLCSDTVETRNPKRSNDLGRVVPVVDWSRWRAALSRSPRCQTLQE